MDIPITNIPKFYYFGTICHSSGIKVHDIKVYYIKMYDIKVHDIKVYKITASRV